MGSIFGGGAPKVDTGAAERRAAAEAAAKAEQEEIQRKKLEDEDAMRRGLRGQRSLFSEAGGELGFSTTLGVS